MLLSGKRLESQPLNFLKTESEIERAFRFFHRPDRHTVGVDHGRFQAGVPQKTLNDPDVVIGLQQVGGEGVAKGVGRR